MLPEVTYQRPGTLRDALQALDRATRDQTPVYLLGGGTDLIPTLKQRVHDSCQLISLSALEELRGISSAGDTITVGAMTTLEQIAASAELGEAFPGLVAAVRSVASPQIRNRATLGGNILVDNRCVYYNQSAQSRDALGGACFKADGERCHLVRNAKPGDSPLCRARFTSDPVAVLLILDARLEIRRAGGTRSIPIREFYRPDGIDRHQLRSDEILTSIAFDRSPRKMIAYKKLRIRDSIDFPSLGVAVGCLADSADKGCEIALTGIDNHPIFLSFRSEDHPGAAQMIETACRTAKRSVTSLRQDFFPPLYRKEMIPVFIKRLALQVGILSEEPTFSER